MRISFDEVFQTNPDGTMSPRGVVKIGGVTMSPGVAFTSGVSFSGVDIATYEGHALEVEQEADGIVVVKGIY